MALTCLYTWNRYRAFGTDIVRNLADAFLTFIYAVFRYRLARALDCQALLEKFLSSSAFALLDTRKSLKPLRRREAVPFGSHENYETGKGK